MIKTRLPATRTIAIVNRKGGVGKSATAANLSHALARFLPTNLDDTRARVLVADSDSQKNLTTHIGTDTRQADRDAPTINEAYRAPKNYATSAIGPSAAAGVDLLYGSSSIEDTEKDLVTMQHPSAGYIMQRIIDRCTADRQYEYVLIDCPPSEGLLTRNAIVAADLILVPVSTDYSSFEGMGRLQELLIKLEAQEAFADRPIPPVYVFPYMVDERTSRSRELRDYIHSDDFAAEHSQGAISISALRSQVHRNEAVPDSYGEHVTIFDFVRVDPNGRRRTNDSSVARGRTEFSALAKEVANVF